MTNKNQTTNITFEEATVSILSMLTEPKYKYAARLLIRKPIINNLKITKDCKNT